MSGSELELSGSSLVSVAVDKVSDSYPGVAEAIQAELNAGGVEDPGSQDLSDINSALDDSLDVPMSDFWDNKEDKQAPAQAAAEEDVVPQSGIITFKADGVDKQMTLEEVSKKLDLDISLVSKLPQESLKKALAKVVGAERAFTKSAQVAKQVKELEARLPELQKKADLLSKLEEIKHDPKLLLNLITGQDYETFMEEQVRRYEIMSKGSDADKRSLEREERLAALERKLADDEESKAEVLRSKEQAGFQSEKAQLKGVMEAEFFKHQFNLGSDADSNDVNEILWERGQRQLSKYVKKYQDHPKFKELLPKMVEKSFAEEAGKLKRLTTEPVQAKVDEVLANKRKKAAEQAQVSGSRSVPELDTSGFSGMSIRDIANKLTGSNRFSI